MEHQAGAPQTRCVLPYRGDSVLERCQQGGQPFTYRLDLGLSGAGTCPIRSQLFRAGLHRNIEARRTRRNRVTELAVVDRHRAARSPDGNLPSRVLQAQRRLRRLRVQVHGQQVRNAVRLLEEGDQLPFIQLLNIGARPGEDISDRHKIPDEVHQRLCQAL